MKLFIYCYIFCNIMHYVNAIEYIYPVGCLPDNETIFLIHQNSVDSIKLLSWNSKTNYVVSALWSLFNPAYFQLLPNNEGFSFIDNGRLRIQYFNKRSPKTLDFDKPLSSINSMQWIDEKSCYCSAYLGNSFAILKCSVDGSIETIVSNKHYDYLYPQYRQPKLFFIERTKNITNNTTHYTIKGKNCITDSFELIMDFKENTIIFLTMKSAIEGFVIEYCNNINSPTIFTFFYHHIYFSHDKWHKEKLFTFTIPIQLLQNNSEERLYESLLPLIPEVINDTIYFVSSDNKNDNLTVYFYNLQLHTIKKMNIHSQQKYFFVPRIYNDRLFIGGEGSLVVDVQSINVFDI